MEDYLQLSVNLIDKHNSDPVNQLNNNLFDHIQENTPFDENNEANHVIYWNIIVNYLNQEDFMITIPELNSLEKIKFRYCKDLFYEIPILLYIIKAYMNNLQKKEDTTSIESDANTYLENCFSIGK